MPPGVGVVQGLITDWILHLEAHNFAKPTIKGYRLTLTGYFQFLESEHKQYDNVDLQLLDRWVVHLRRVKELNPRSINTGITGLRNFYRWAYRNHYVYENPAREMQMLRTDRPLPKPMSEKDIVATIEAAERPMDRAFLETMYATGARIGEMISMNTDGLDLDAGTVRCTGKRGIEKLLILTPPAVEAITTYLAWRRSRPLDNPTPGGPLWIGKLHKRIAAKSVRERLRDCARRAGVEGKVWPHRFRHSFATHLLDHGAGLREVQEAMGHASIISTQLYTEVSKARLAKVIRQSHPRATPLDQHPPPPPERPIESAPSSQAPPDPLWEPIRDFMHMPR